MVKLVGVVSNDDDTKLWQNSRRSLQKISLQRSIAKGWPLVCGVLRATERRKIPLEFHKEQSCQECPSLMSVLDYERTVTDVFLFY